MNGGRLFTSVLFACALTAVVGLGLGSARAQADDQAPLPEAILAPREVASEVLDDYGGARSIWDGAADWTLTGEGANNYFGGSVAAAGDVNGDGYGDVIVGAHRYNGFQGRVYVYAGGAGGLSSTPIFTATGEATNNYFGYSVATAGDVNGDGYADIVVGAYGYNSFQGRAYVYVGGAAGVSPTPIFTATGESADSELGLSVATAGDVNGDGYDDIAIGAHGYSSSQGRAYVYGGGATGLSATPIFTATGEGTGDEFGYSVATAGDVNGDGYADVVIGAYAYNLEQGQAYVYAGEAGGLAATPLFTATGETTVDRFGYSVATAGDVNGDGYSDVVVGAWGYNSSQGRAYIYAGAAAGLSATPISTATGETTSNDFGISVATAGDVNGDGYADVMIGAMLYSGMQGRAYLYTGSAGGLSATPILTGTGQAAGDLLGSSVATAGDVNGDGYAEVIVGEYRYGTNQGRAYVYAGGAGRLSATPIFTATGKSTGDSLGYSAATAGDVNADGYADVVVGACGFNSWQGRAYVYAGGAGGLSATPILTATGEATGDYFGLSVAPAGDVDGDGYGDVIVGAYGHNGNQGRAYVYAGGPGGLSATPVFTATGEGTNDVFGYSVATAGDMNGDGYADVIVGAYGLNSWQGRAYVYAGGAAGMSATPVFTATGEATSNDFGISVAAAGDVNGDGYGDVVVGAYGYNGNQGRAYVYAGGAASLSATPISTATGEAAGDDFGIRVAAAGDVNGDGYADVAVGAFGYNSDQGRAYVYAGGPGGLSASPIFTATGEGTGDYFGLSVGAAGDVDGDGYADVVAGAHGYNGNQGRAYVYAGGPGGLSAAPVFTVTGEGSADSFGHSAASAGDVNGDGYADVIVGAPSYVGVQGRVYVYGGNGGSGRLVLAQQLLAYGSGSPVQPWGRSPLAVQVELIATSPLGREGVRLQVEACPPGAAFGDGSCTVETAPGWTDVTTGSTGVPLSVTVTIPTDSALVRWRARVLYDSPLMTQGPWRRFLGQALEADVRVECERVYLPLVLRSY
jgi:hypothetical protein